MGPERFLFKRRPRLSYSTLYEYTVGRTRWLGSPQPPDQHIDLSLYQCNFRARQIFFVKDFKILTALVQPIFPVGAIE